jgi:hypothetical protein
MLREVKVVTKRSRLGKGGVATVTNPTPTKLLFPSGDTTQSGTAAMAPKTSQLLPKLVTGLVVRPFANATEWANNL